MASAGAVAVVGTVLGGIGKLSQAAEVKRAASKNAAEARRVAAANAAATLVAAEADKAQLDRAAIAVVGTGQRTEEELNRQGEVTAARMAAVAAAGGAGPVPEALQLRLTAHLATATGDVRYVATEKSKGMKYQGAEGVRRAREQGAEWQTRAANQGAEWKRAADAQAGALQLSALGDFVGAGMSKFSPGPAPSPVSDVNRVNSFDDNSMYRAMTR